MDKELWEALNRAFKVRGFVHTGDHSWVSKDLTHQITESFLVDFISRGEKRETSVADIPIVLLDDARGIRYWGPIGWSRTVKPVLEEALKGV